MTTLLSNFVRKVQTKHWQNLRRKTQKLDPSEKVNLVELLEDNLSAPSNNVQCAVSDNNNIDDDDDDEFVEEDYELLQRDLDRANLRLEELQSKHDFFQTRLETYRSAISRSEDVLAEQSEQLPPERSRAMAAKIDGYKKALEPVENTYQTVSSELSSQVAKIESMQDRQLELKLKTQECQVVLEELCYGMEATARVPFSDQDVEILAKIQDKDEEHEIETKTIDPGSSFRDEHEDDVETAGTNTTEDKNGKEEQAQP